MRNKKLIGLGITCALSICMVGCGEKKGHEEASTIENTIESTQTEESKNVTCVDDISEEVVSSEITSQNIDTESKDLVAEEPEMISSNSTIVSTEIDELEEIPIPESIDLAEPFDPMLE